MNLVSFISKHRIRILNANTKDDVLEELIELIGKTPLKCDIEVLRESIFYREQLMSTGIGLGLGIPHVRIEGITEPFVTIGVSHDGISDYEAIDNKIVTIVIMIVAGKNQHKEYIKLLSNIVTVLKKPGVIDRLIDAEDEEGIYDIIISEAAPENA